MAMEEGLSRVELEGRTHWIEYKSEVERLEVLLIDDSLKLWKGSAPMGALRPAGISAHSYLGLLRKALRCPAGAAGHFQYTVSFGAKGGLDPKQCRLTINFKLGANTEDAAAGDIWLRGVDLGLRQCSDSRAVLTEFLSRQARASLRAQEQRQELRAVEEERERFRRAAEKAASERVAAEGGLLQGFIKILNEKKRRLNELQEQVNQLAAEVRVKESALAAAARAPPKPPPPPQQHTATPTPPRAAQVPSSSGGIPESYPDFARLATAALAPGLVEDADDGDIGFSSAASESSQASRKRGSSPPPAPPAARRRIADDVNTQELLFPDFD
eukprot:Hpha_TRINITY_DN16476_c6_g1::TRINITY_DN16476_c6_g1_i3::g.160587::m.160587/K10886/XRCC4; DNA-repair protein XRCC4